MGQGQGATAAAAAPEASQPGASPSSKKSEAQWMPPGSLPVDPTKPHRKPANSCDNIKKDMVQCYEGSRCYKEGAPFEECLNSNDADWVSSECIWLRKGYAQCRRDLLNRNRIWQRGNRAA